MYQLVVLVLLSAQCSVPLAQPSNTRTFTVDVPAAQKLPTPPDAEGNVPEAQFGCIAVPVSDTPSEAERAIFNVTTKLMELDRWLPSTANSSEDLDDLLTNPCGLNGVQQTYPLSPVAFALNARPTTSLDQLPTDCLSMMAGGTDQLKVIQFDSYPHSFAESWTSVLSNDNGSSLTEYHVCSDTEWEHSGWVHKYTVGPVQTWLILVNFCPLQPAQVQITVNRTDSNPDPYCNTLAEQNRGQYRIWTLLRLLYFGALALAAMALLVVTGLCTCCCRLPLAVPACQRSAGEPLQNMLDTYRNALDRVGMGWLSGRGLVMHTGGVAYAHRGGRYGIAYDLLLCSLVLTVLATYSHVTVPIYDHTDSVATGSRFWSITDSSFQGAVQGPSITFALAILVSVAYSFMTFMVAVVHFSDPLVDPWFHSKLVFLGFCLLLGQLPLWAARIDFWMNVREWKFQASQIILQGVISLMIVLTDAAFILVVLRVRRLHHQHGNTAAAQRAIHAKQALHSKLVKGEQRAGTKQNSKPMVAVQPARSLSALVPRSNEAAEPSSLDSNTVNTRGSSSVTGSQNKLDGIGKVNGRGQQSAGAVMEGMESVGGLEAEVVVGDVVHRGNEQGVVRGDNDQEGCTAPKAEEMHDDGVAFDDWMPQKPAEAVKELLGASSRHSLGGRHSVGGRLSVCEDPVSTIHGLAAGDESDHGGWKRRTVLQTLDAVNSLNGIETGPAGSEGEWREPSRSIFDIPGHLRVAWQSVCPTEAFEYSTFFMAALIVTTVILTYSFVNAVYRISALADCMRKESTCFHRAQLWILKNVVAGLPGAVYLPERSAAVCRTSSLISPELAANSTDSALATRLSAECEVLERATSVLQSLQPVNLPEWLENSRVPLLIGGEVGFSLAYLLGLYTIMHVAAAYKRFSRQIVVANVVESLTLRPLQQPKEFGTSLLSDYRQVHIGQSAYFMGMLVSTCWLQLWWAGSLCTAIITTLLHSQFWSVLLKDQWGWVVSIAAVTVWHMLSQAAINRFVVSGAKIKMPFVWVFIYISFSTLYVVVAILLAVIRVFLLLSTTVLALSRLDKCIFTIAKQSDNGYKSFLAMTLMLHAVKLQTAQDGADSMPVQRSFSAAALKTGDKGAAGVAVQARRGVSMDRVYDRSAAEKSGAGQWKLTSKNMGRVSEGVNDCIE